MQPVSQLLAELQALGDPFKGVVTVPSFLSRALSFVLIIGAIIVFLCLLWGGFQWLTAGDDQSKIQNARQRLTQCLIGFAILATSFAIAIFVQYFFGISIFEAFGSSGPLPTPPSGGSPPPIPSPPNGTGVGDPCDPADPNSCSQCQHCAFSYSGYNCQPSGEGTPCPPSNTCWGTGICTSGTCVGSGWDPACGASPPPGGNGGVPTATPTSSELLPPAPPIACDPSNPSLTPLIVDSGSINLPPYPPYVNFGEVRFYLISKQNNDATLNSSIDILFADYDSNQLWYIYNTSIDGNYLILGINDPDGIAGGSYPQSYIPITIGGQIFAIRIPSFSFTGAPGQRYYFYVANDGSIYHAHSNRAPITASSWTQAIDLSPSEAFQPGNIAEVCIQDTPPLPTPPVNQYSCTTGTSGEPSYLNLRLSLGGSPYANQTAFAATWSREPGIPAAWCSFPTDNFGAAILNGLYHLYLPNMYYLFGFELQGNILRTSIRDRLESSLTVPAQTSIAFNSQLDLSPLSPPPTGQAANLSGTYRVFLSGAPLPAPGIPIYLYNIDTQELFGTKSDNNSQYQFAGITSGRYVIIAEFWGGPNLYTHRTNIANCQRCTVIQPGNNTLNLLLR